MLVIIIDAILALLGLYIAVGVVVAIWLHRCLREFDPGVAGAGIGFRLLVTPGMIALWPALVARLRRARAGNADAPDPDLPVRAAGLRRRHGLYIQLIAVVVPLVAGAALALRPPETVSSNPLPALARVVREDPNPYPGFAIASRVRSDRYGWRWQLELDVRDSIPLRHPVVYWMPAPDAAAGVPSQFIGALNGPGAYLFSIPENLATGDGNFVILSLEDGVALNRALVGKG